VKRALITLLAVVASIATVAAFALWPICVPLSDAQLAAFNVPIEQRTDRDLYLTVFQKRDGRWHQCKTRLSRAFFF